MHYTQHCFASYVLVSLISTPLLVYSVSFNFTSFDASMQSIFYEGDAKPSSGIIQLNTHGYYRVGRASYAGSIKLWDTSTSKLTNFTTHFIFTVDKNDSADGFAFYLADVGYPIPPNSAAGFLGLFNNTSEGVLQRKVVAIEFDNYVNGQFDPDDKHVGINNNSIISLKYAKWDVDLRLTHVWITYNGLTKNLSVFWTNQTNPVYMGNSSLSYAIDLSQVLPQWVTVGFSGTTGLAYEHHAIHSWEFASSFNSTRNIYDHKRKRTINTKILVMVIIALVIIVVFLGFFIMLVGIKGIKKYGKRCKLGIGGSLDFDLEREALPRRFPYQELVEATNHFAEERKLGQGGSGQVYKGTLAHLGGRLVAVKRIFADYGNSEKIFTNEVKIISRLIHRNLVKFIGWCHEENEMLLVFEYMSNGSLDTHLNGIRRNGNSTLAWNARYKIALGLASAIHYLHEDAEQSVLHRDIKPANVLLDEDFSTKLGDFGVAKLVDPRPRTQMTTGVVGTYGYLAPEYANGGRATIGSDIYSFGVVALEIACGRKTFQDGEYHVPLATWVWQLHVNGRNIIEAADERLNMEFDAEEMRCLLSVGLWCTHPNDKERPKIGEVIKTIQQVVRLPTLQARDMRESLAIHQSPAQSISTSIVQVGR